MADPTTGDLIRAKTIASDEVNAAVDAFMRDPTVSLLRFASGHTVDPAAAVRSHPFANATISGGKAWPARKRKAVQSAILLARPTAP